MSTTSGLKNKGRAVARRLWILFVYCSGLLWWAKRRLLAKGSVIVLNFHRVLPEAQFCLTGSTPGMLLREKTFDHLVRSVASRFVAVGLRDLKFKDTDAGGHLRLAFTFDDGWVDTALVAFPITQKYGIPLTVFICPHRLGGHLPYWPERVVNIWNATEQFPELRTRLLALFECDDVHRMAEDRPDELSEGHAVVSYMKILPEKMRSQILQEMQQVEWARSCGELRTDSTMTWEQVKALSRQEVNFGSHTQTHPLLPQISSDDASRELFESKLAIEQHLNQDCTLFSYPNGNWSGHIRSLVERSGYQFAFVNTPGAWSPETDPFLIPRVEICEEQDRKSVV
jgi:peptidoglycan/xylan/chitin deacetylase (PgdA/CDA1 family)